MMTFSQQNDKNPRLFKRFHSLELTTVAILFEYEWRLFKRRFSWEAQVSSLNHAWSCQSHLRCSRACRLRFWIVPPDIALLDLSCRFLGHFKNWVNSPASGVLSYIHGCVLPTTAIFYWCFFSFSILPATNCYKLHFVWSCFAYLAIVSIYPPWIGPHGYVVYYVHYVVEREMHFHILTEEQNRTKPT